jgi:hypothetical protein
MDGRLWVQAIVHRNLLELLCLSERCGVFRSCFAEWFWWSGD